MHQLQLLILQFAQAKCQFILLQLAHCLLGVFLLLHLFGCILIHSDRIDLHILCDCIRFNTHARIHHIYNCLNCSILGLFNFFVNLPDLFICPLLLFVFPLLLSVSILLVFLRHLFVCLLHLFRHLQNIHLNNSICNNILQFYPLH